MQRSVSVFTMPYKWSIPDPTWRDPVRWVQVSKLFLIFENLRFAEKAKIAEPSKIMVDGSGTGAGVISDNRKSVEPMKDSYPPSVNLN